jgi:hypothetical protein
MGLRATWKAASSLRGAPDERRVQRGLYPPTQEGRRRSIPFASRVIRISPCHHCGSVLPSPLGPSHPCSRALAAVGVFACSLGRLCQRPPASRSGHAGPSRHRQRTSISQREDTASPPPGPAARQKGTRRSNGDSRRPGVGPSGPCRRALYTSGSISRINGSIGYRKGFLCHQRMKQ